VQALAREERFKRDLLCGADRGIYDWELSGYLSNLKLLEAVRQDCYRRGEPLPIGGGTTFSGFETLMSQSATPAAVGPSAAELSLLDRSAVEPVAPAYLLERGYKLWMKANGLITTTATVPTHNFRVKADVTYANPVAGVILTALAATITPRVASNMMWYLDVMMTVRAGGSGGTILAVGTFINQFVTSGVSVATDMQNASPPTAVTQSGTGGLAVSNYFDLVSILGAATAGNTQQCLDYALVSMR
jgi:hypothetical protein